MKYDVATLIEERTKKEYKDLYPKLRDLLSGLSIAPGKLDIHKFDDSNNKDNPLPSIRFGNANGDLIKINGPYDNSRIETSGVLNNQTKVVFRIIERKSSDKKNKFDITINVVSGQGGISVISFNDASSSFVINYYDDKALEYFYEQTPKESIEKITSQEHIITDSDFNNVGIVADEQYFVVRVDADSIYKELGTIIKNPEEYIDYAKNNFLATGMFSSADAKNPFTGFAGPRR